ncbi:MAG TPA: hypothetical protein EYQ24_13210 [Bacteroidetes bacterium]|nr:hypothetical protein [Bacteroidota bacterium]HIL57406.1 hypothetical protein [Rhodothermales bacterium]
MRRAAFLTMDSLDGFVAYDDLVKPPLRERGWSVTDVPWRSGADWDAFEAVVIRTPWDYQDDPAAFLEVLREIEHSRAHLANGLDAVRWNLTKTYLRELAAHGVPTVPTLWGDTLTPGALAELRGTLGHALVLKPTVGANADHAFRLGPDADPADALATFADRPYMAQGFVRSVVDWGEASLFYFDGAYSHAVRKTPAAGDFRVQEEHGGRIQSLTPDDALREAAQCAVETASRLVGTPLLYARPDLVRLADGSWALMELELIEPSLYFPYDAASPERFAEAFVNWMARAEPRP